MVTVGILGMGMMGWFHTSQYLKLPNAQLAAIADITPERLEAENAVVGNIAGKAGRSTSPRSPATQTPPD